MTTTLLKNHERNYLRHRKTKAFANKNSFGLKVTAGTGEVYVRQRFVYEGYSKTIERAKELDSLIDPEVEALSIDKGRYRIRWK